MSNCKLINDWTSLLNSVSRHPWRFWQLYFQSGIPSIVGLKSFEWGILFCIRLDASHKKYKAIKVKIKHFSFDKVKWFRQPRVNYFSLTFFFIEYLEILELCSNLRSLYEIDLLCLTELWFALFSIMNRKNQRVNNRSPASLTEPCPKGAPLE